MTPRRLRILVVDDNEAGRYATGRVLRQDFNLDPGETVKAGQVLACLDSTDLQLTMEKDKIDFAAAKERFATDRSTELSLESLRADLEHQIPDVQPPEPAQQTEPDAANEDTAPISLRDRFRAATHRGDD